MIYSVNFLEMTEKLNPLAVSKYLAVTGWKQILLKRQDVHVYQFAVGESFRQVLVPLDKQLRDYRERMYETVQEVATVEKRSVEQVMLYLLNPNADILRIRLDNKEIEAGNILFDDAINLYDNAKRLLAATASDIINPKKIHYGKVSDSVQKFLGGCRFGQTEIGSYIVSIVCPFTEMTGKQLSIFSDEEQCANSLTRQVTNRLMRNVSVIQQKVAGGDIRALIGEDMGISSNFYEALNGLNSQSENTLVEFTAEWSPTVKANRFDCNKVAITNDYYQPLATVIETIKGRTNKRTEIVGKIKQLTAVPSVDEREKGTAVVVYVGDKNRAKTVSVVLDRVDYESAVVAHQHGKAVRVIGDITGINKPRMENVAFSVIE